MRSGISILCSGWLCIICRPTGKNGSLIIFIITVSLRPSSTPFCPHTHIQVCQGKRWGPECANFCPCGVGNRCNPVTGDCICNSCWSGTNCDMCKSWSMVHPWYIAIVTGILFVFLLLCEYSLRVPVLFTISAKSTEGETEVVSSDTLDLMHTSPKHTLHIASRQAVFQVSYMHICTWESLGRNWRLLDLPGMHVCMYSPQAFITSTWGTKGSWERVYVSSCNSTQRTQCKTKEPIRSNWN